MLKNDFENQNFEIFANVAHNFGNFEVTLFSEKMLISTRYIRGFRPNSIKKSVTVSTRQPLQ